MKTIFVSILLSITMPSFDLTSTADWALVKEKDYLRIFDTQEVNRRFKTFRVQGNFDADLAKFESIILDTDYLVDWFPMASNATVINRKSPEEFTVRILFDFPFPMKNRDAYLTIHKNNINPNEISYIMELDNRWPISPEFERIEILHSHTSVSLQGETIFVDQITYLDPGGSIPKLFLNNGLPNSMAKSFNQLAALLE